MWWLKNDELLALPPDYSDVERAEVIKLVVKRMESRPAMWILLGAVCIGVPVISVLLGLPIGRWLHTQGMGIRTAHAIGVMLVALPTAFAIVSYGLMSMKNVFADAAIDAMREIGRDICSDCGEWLRDQDNSETTCPHCGAERKGKVAVDP
jgi:hypothetical protein